jgi:sugar/nucleoside kinase (ribokinase family)
MVVGDFFMDVVMSGFRSFPRLGEEAFAQRLRQEIGGGAAITSCGLARLGMNVAVLGVVGQEDGIWLVKRMMAAGVNASALEHHPNEPSGVTVSVSTAKDRAFYTYYGANEHLPLLLQDPDAHRTMAQARHVHFACGPDPGLNAGLFAQLRDSGSRVSIDVGWYEYWLSDPQSLTMLREADMFFPNEREAERMTGQSEPERMLQWFQKHGVRRVALKLGEKGAMLLCDDDIYQTPPFTVKAIDTTGAGDCFDAGFIYAWLRGYQPEECLRIASICGALSTRGLGGIETFPDKEELEGALEEVHS